MLILSNEVVNVVVLGGGFWLIGNKWLWPFKAVVGGPDGFNVVDGQSLHIRCESSCPSGLLALDPCRFPSDK